MLLTQKFEKSRYSGTKIVQKLKQKKEVEYWPTDGWRTALPEQHGMDSAAIASALDEFKDCNLHSFVLIRNGYVIAEGYNKDWDADKIHPTYSVTKSITSAVAGVALKVGSLDNVDQKLGEFFPEINGDPDLRKANITINQLLSMTSGLEWDNRGERSSVEMADSPNWIQYVLDRKMKHDPGAVFNYSNGNAHLLSGLLERALGVPIGLVAEHELFKPMGMTHTLWGQDLQGVSIGSWALRLTARDMAKFGLLYLHNGQWDGNELIPRSWVESSVQQRTGLPYADGTQGGYGYFWWLKPISADTNPVLRQNVFYAAGSGGQRIFVVPGHNLILVTTGNNQKDDYMPERMLAKLALAIKSDRPLPVNAAAAAKLKSSIRAFKESVDKPE